MPPRIPCANTLKSLTEGLQRVSLRAPLSTTASNGEGVTIRRVDHTQGSSGRSQSSSRENSSDRVARGIANVLRRNENRQQAITGGARRSEVNFEELKKSRVAGQMSKLLYRKFNAGDVYAPHDMSVAEMNKYKYQHTSGVDALDVLALNPIHEYKNFAMMSEYVTTSGRIKRREYTGLRAVNQRRLAKAFRRSVGLGLMPSSYHHPEILMQVAIRERSQ